MKYLFLSVLANCFLNLGQATQVVIYEPPKSAQAAAEFELEVNGKPVFVYHTRTAAIAYFSFEGKVEVKVNFLAPIDHFDIRPKNSHINAALYRNQISFTIDKPENLSVEINKNLKRPLFIFASPLETVFPNKNDPQVVFFEKGKIHNPGVVYLKNNQIVYIEGGAIVRGSFICSANKNIKIIGRGILDNSHYEKGAFRPIEINQSEDVLIDGIIISEAKHWTCASIASKNIVYNNLKIVSDNDWDDGIDIVGSKNILINNCFIRTKDDCIAIKSGANYYTNFFSGYNTENITIQNSIFWNGIWGNALEIGFETRCDTIQNVTFRNCDLIHVEGPEGSFTIHNGDRALVREVLYEDIRVEDSRGWLIDFKILKSQYTKDSLRGKIENIYFKNITVEGDVFPYSQIMGFGESNKIKHITLENFVIHGKKVTSTYNGAITSIHADELIFK